MTKVKFVMLNALGEEVSPPQVLDIDIVPQKDDYVGLFDRGGVVSQVQHRYGNGRFRGGKIEQEITVMIRAN